MPRAAKSASQRRSSKKTEPVIVEVPDDVARARSYPISRVSRDGVVTHDRLHARDSTKAVPSRDAVGHDAVGLHRNSDATVIPDYDALYMRPLPRLDSVATVIGDSDVFYVRVAEEIPLAGIAAPMNQASEGSRAGAIALASDQ